MKKLLIIALLMLALVITAVACNDDPVEPGTSGDEVTTVETPTEAPTDEPSTPAPETDPETPAPETDPETPAPETDPETPAPETDPETPAPETDPETEPEPDPADPVFMLDAEALNTLAGAAAPNVQHLGSTEVITEGNKTFVRWTTAGGDPYVAIIPLGSDYTLPQYMAISYRTNSTKDGQFFLGSGAGWTGAGDSFMAAWTEGDWSFVIIDLTQTGVTSITDGKLTYCRLDFFTDAGNEGDYFDVQYVGFFNTAEYAAAYDFEMNKAPMWGEDKSVVTHLSFDQLYAGNGDAGNGPENIFTPGQSGGWDFIADYSDIAYADFTVDTLTFWGWVGVKGEIGQFGYQVNGGAPIYDDAWTFNNPAEGLINHCPAGTDNATRMKIAISLAGLEGEHTIRTLYKTPDGIEVCLAEFTVKLPTRPTHYDNYTVPQDQWVITGHNTNLNDSSNPMVAAGGVESGALLHQGSIALGEVDLSKYSKVVVMWGCDNSAVTVGHYDANANNRIMLLNAEMSNVMSPAEETILAGGTYELKGWAVTAFEIDLTDVDYNGPVWLAIDALPGTFALFASVEFIGGEIDYSEPEAPIYNDYIANETINWAPNGITVDGAIADWNGLNVSTIPADKFVSWVGTTPEGFNMTAGFAADADYLYGVIYAADDAVVSGTQVNSYNGDVLQVAITMNGKQSWYSFSYKAEGENYIINTANAITEGAELATVAVEGGWLAEIKLPISVLFADAGITEFTFDAENPWAMQVLVCSLDCDADANTLSSAIGTFLGTEAWKDNGFTLTLNWAEGIALNTGIVAPEEPVVPDEPDVPAVENLVIPQDQWVITGHNTKLNDSTNPMVAAGGVESAALLHQGSIALGEIDLSKYSKVIIYWGSDNGPGTQDLYAKNEHNRFALVNADKNMQMSPNEDTIVAAVTYELHGWAVAPIEIDLTGIDYNGPLFLTHDSLTGGFALVYSIEFVA